VEGSDDGPRYYRDSEVPVAMHVTVLQPLLILAAIAIVGAVPLLGVTVPMPSMGASPTVAQRAEGGMAARQSGTSSRVKLDAAREGSASPAYASMRGDALASLQRCWAVRGGACVLPPPRA
jgi:hypothetical protein